MSQNEIHQRRSLIGRRRSATIPKSWKTATTGLRHMRPRPCGPVRIAAISIGQPAPTITASPTFRAIARLWHAIQTASARPTLTINVPCARIVVIRRQAPKSSARRTIRRNARPGFPAGSSAGPLWPGPGRPLAIPARSPGARFDAASPATCPGRSSGWRAGSRPGDRGCPLPLLGHRHGATAARISRPKINCRIRRRLPRRAPQARRSSQVQPLDQGKDGADARRRSSAANQHNQDRRPARRAIDATRTRHGMPSSDGPGSHRDSRPTQPICGPLRPSSVPRRATG